MTKGKTIIPREKVKFNKEIDQTSNHFTLNGVTYNKVDEIQRHGDGQEHDVIVQRETDGKYFKYTWTYFPDACSNDYEFDTEMVEVFQCTKITYE